MFIAEIEIEAGLRNVVTAIASTLRPGAVVALPVLSAILLPCTMTLPAAALLYPSAPLLPRDCLLLRTLRLLLTGLFGTLFLLLRLRPLLLSLLDPLRLLLLPGLLGTLYLLLRPGCLSLLGLLLLVNGLRLLLLPRLLPDLLCLLLRPRGMCLLGPLRLLSGLCVLLLLRPLLRLLRANLPLLRLRLRTLLLCGWPRGRLRFRLMLLRPCLFLILLLCPGRDHRPEKHKRGSGSDNSNELHRTHPSVKRHCRPGTWEPSPLLACCRASAASASALVLCTVPSG